MPKANGTETFTEMRNRLMQVHGWCRRIATIAARYYLGVENNDDLGARTQSQPILSRGGEDYRQGPEITLATARKIVMLR
ncbi:MAG: hypothetical protein JRD89_02000 [Deltaproteobacteria bacterium]|nr:hypothetical protein [Deltaproteobacteria bacterium]